MIDLETFAEHKSLCFLTQLWPSIYLEPEEPLFPGVFVPHSWKEEAEPPQLERWVKNVVAGSNQAQESFGAYGPQCVVQVQQLGECPAGRLLPALQQQFITA